ncbi:hypothetical protein, partial [Actinotalea sp.]|uniref:hypothetical protein n=1 Tax=Actinotalea sp. TaxID=1872145 RepID=UPI002B9CFDDA
VVRQPDRRELGALAVGGGERAERGANGPSVVEAHAGHELPPIVGRPAAAIVAGRSVLTESHHAKTVRRAGAAPHLVEGSAATDHARAGPHAGCEVAAASGRADDTVDRRSGVPAEDGR